MFSQFSVIILLITISLKLRKIITKSRLENILELMLLRFIKRMNGKILNQSYAIEKSYGITILRMKAMNTDISYC